MNTTTLFAILTAASALAALVSLAASDRALRSFVTRTRHHEAQYDICPIARLEIDADGNCTRATLYAPGLPPGRHDVFPVGRVTTSTEMARAEERERCATVCEEMPSRGSERDAAAMDCAAAIRAQPKPYKT